MRMWGVPVSLLCNKHLVGEHGEIELFVWCIRHGRNLGGYYSGGLMDTRLIQTRHNELANEMVRRGLNHNSPLLYNDRLGLGGIDVEENIRELERRCARCRQRIQQSAA